jgi:hypothetical protein
MPDFAESTLWRISAFERVRADGGLADAGPSLLSSTLMTDLRRLQRDRQNDDVLEVIAACLRHREPALLYLALGALVWPVTVFPQEGLYHSPRAVEELGSGGPMAQLKLLNAERPGLRPPGHVARERIGAEHKYHPISGLTWAVALYGPRSELLQEIGGRSAYRLAPGRAEDLPHTPGALAPAVQKLRQASVALRDIARWPGMSLERSSRLLNALYLDGALMVTRSHPAARDEPQGWWARRRGS